jgi:hypothetical protein
MYQSGLVPLRMLTGLTALQLEATKPFQLPGSVAQLSQLRQLQLSGAILPQSSEGAAPDPCLPRSLTGLTLMARNLGWERAWAGQLQHCGAGICSLEVQLHADGTPDDNLSSFLSDLGTVGGAPQAVLGPVLPQLTTLVFRKISCEERDFAFCLPKQPHLLASLFPSLLHFHMLQTKTFFNFDFDFQHLLALSGCSHVLRELSCVTYCDDDGDAVPSDLVFPQLTRLKADCVYVDGMAPGFQNVMHHMFPALQDLTIGYGLPPHDEVLAAALARCTSITRLVMCVPVATDPLPVAWIKIVAAGLSSLQRLELTLDSSTAGTVAALASIPSQSVAQLAAFTQVQGLRVEFAPWERMPGVEDYSWLKCCAQRTEAQPEAASNMQLALLSLLQLKQLQQLELCNIAGVSAAVLAALTGQLPVLQLLQLEGCSEGPDESVDQWHTAETAAARSSGGRAGGMWSRLQLVRAGLRPGVKLEVQPSSWLTCDGVYW